MTWATKLETGNPHNPHNPLILPLLSTKLDFLATHLPCTSTNHHNLVKPAQHHAPRVDLSSRITHHACPANVANCPLGPDVRKRPPTQAHCFTPNPNPRPIAPRLGRGPARTAPNLRTLNTPRPHIQPKPNAQPRPTAPNTPRLNHAWPNPNPTGHSPPQHRSHW